VASLVHRVEVVARTVLEFLASLPTLAEFESGGGGGGGGASAGGALDGLPFWLRGQLRAMEPPSASGDDLVRCARCTTAVVLPRSATAEPEMRLLCGGCGAIAPVADHVRAPSDGEVPGFGGRPLRGWVAPPRFGSQDPRREDDGWAP